MTEAPDTHRSESRSPLLLLSSGARARYLEDVVRALALPTGGRLQFRYELELIAPSVVAQNANGGLTGRTCYITYLDNRTPGLPPEIVPIREATARTVLIRGSSLILMLEIGRYIRTNELHNLQAAIQNRVQDRLPTWRRDHSQHPERPFDGYWVNLLDSPLPADRLVAHDGEGSHLGIFEESVRHLIGHAHDFGDQSRRLFFNVLGLFDSSNVARELVDGGWKIGPAEDYRLNVYHYFPEEGPLTTRPTYWIGWRTFGEGLSLAGNGYLKADSEYDSKSIVLRAKGAVQATRNTLTVFRTTGIDDEDEASADLQFDVEVEPDRRRNILQASMIGVFVAAPSLIAIHNEVPSWKALLILVAGLLAGFASVFKFSRTP